ncbi:hypothetical protein IEQ34_014461 [Dendrobium chrysotoxum]|uniref:Uncharacterized protein n=1 Tax=Dendrobium chrysotoxum TaxID=161865 RepID=A0AAV7G3X5_DENCH|nr:hypothetical protein IEQ34_014461 [Dendrobium chrysotoxum]
MGEDLLGFWWLTRPVSRSSRGGEGGHLGARCTCFRRGSSSRIRKPDNRNRLPRRSGMRRWTRSDEGSAGKRTHRRVGRGCRVGKSRTPPRPGGEGSGRLDG